MARTLESKIVSRSEISRLSEKLKGQGKTIVTTNGCFDLLHVGHIQYLFEAKKCGDVLIIGLNSDDSVKNIKGPKRPIFPEKARALQLAGLESVDYVVIFPDDTPEKLLSLIKPHVHVKGGDYKPEQMPESKVVEAGGGKVKILGFIDGYSSTKILEALRS